MSSRNLHRPPLPTAAELCQPDHDDAATRQQHKRDQRRRHKLSHRLSRQILEVPAPGRQNWDWPSESLPIGDDTIQREAMEMAKALKEECVGSSDSDKAVKQWLSGLKKLSKNNLLHNLLTGYHSKPSLFDRFDVHMVQDSRQLSDVLKTDFDFIKAAGSWKVVHTHDWDIRKQVESIGNGYCVAYQPAKSSKDNVFTQRIEAGDLGRIFLDKKAEVSEHGLNCLNLQNLSGRTFQPSAIGDVDLVGLIRRRLFTGNAGRQEGYLMANEEWMLLTHGPAFSPLHVDAAGYCTMLVILAGEKHWCTISGRWKQVFDEFVLRGPAGANYLHPICETSLVEGDLIIQGPGTPHAVMTVDDSLAAGYFFYTAPHSARSIECVHRELAKEMHTNDEIGAKDFEKLALIIRHIDMEGLFTSEQKADIWTRLGFFLEDMGLIHRHGDVERRRKKSRSRGGSGRTSRGGTRAESGKTGEAKQMFFDACVEWYRAKADAWVAEA